MIFSLIFNEKILRRKYKEQTKIGQSFYFYSTKQSLLSATIKVDKNKKGFS